MDEQQNQAQTDRRQAHEQQPYQGDDRRKQDPVIEEPGADTEAPPQEEQK